jgi:hypothetical protein
VTPWSRANPIAPLRNSLVLNVITFWAPHIPHEGFLADFLMRNKGFIGG